MNVVVIAPNATAAAAALRAWKQRLSANDTVYALNAAVVVSDAPTSLDVRAMEIGENTTLRSRVIRKIGRSLGRRGYFPSVYLADLWPDLLWTVRSFDPDVIDVSGMYGKRRLQRWFDSAGPWQVLRSDGDWTTLSRVESYRLYDPSCKVSIVLPVYNGAGYLREALDSCLTQTHQNLELIVVDDCSRDETPAIVREYARRDSRVRSIRNARNTRLPGALNIGFRAATGELLTWTSHDNLYLPTAVETLVRYLCTWPDVDLVYSMYRVIDANGHPQDSVNTLPARWRMPYENVVGAYFLYRRAVYETVGDYREDMEYSEDYEYWARIYKAGLTLMRLPYPQYYYRHHPASMTSEAATMKERPHTGDKVRREHFQPA